MKPSLISCVILDIVVLCEFTSISEKLACSSTLMMEVQVFHKC
jgi:hypothetical protein